MDKQQEERHWYAFYTKSRAEKTVFSRLEKTGFEAFLPLITTLRTWSDRKKKVKVPLINSYVFVKVKNSEIYKVLQTAGIVRVLRHLGKPAIVRDYEIENLRILIDQGQYIKKIEDFRELEIGMDIEIDQGPMKGLRGKCVSIRGKRSIVVEISSLGDFFQVSVPLASVKLCK